MRTSRFGALHFLPAFLALTLLAAHSPEPPAKPTSAGPPNIILILTDDQDTLLESVEYMPNVKSLLAEQGATVPNNLVPLSLCCPSRTTILRGQYPHNTHVLTNNLPNGGFEKVYSEGLESATVATVLHAAGYRTILLGKYLNGYPDTAPPNYIPPGWDEWYSPVAGNPYSEYNYTLNENGVQVSYGNTPTDYLTDVIHAKAVNFIQGANPAQPVFMYFATYAPHEPYTPAPRHAGLFPNIKAPRPPTFNEPDVTGKPAYIRGRARLSQAQVATIDENYRDRLRALQAVDEAIGDLVATLSATGRLSNTYLFFASDNGYHMGEHRLLPGKYTPYGTDIHVPLVARGPGIPAGVVVNQFTADLDLPETFAELAGVPPLPFSDGRSLVGLLKGTPPQAWRQAFLLEEFNQGEVIVTDNALDAHSPLGIREPPDPQDLQETAFPIPSYYGFQTPDYKYIEYLDNTTGAVTETELYLASDPFEMTNLASLITPGLNEALENYTQTLIGCQTAGCHAAEAMTPPALPASFSATTPIPASFFAMSAVNPANPPGVTVGAFGHLSFAWPILEPARGTFDFSSYDAYLADAMQQGLVDSTNTAAVAMTFGLTPSWAVADQTSCTKQVRGSSAMQCTAPPDNIQDWKDFVTAVMHHYNGATKPHIRYYELWNEFNDNSWWTGTDAQMLALAQAAYPIVHQDPDAMLLTPSVTGPVGTGAPNSAITAMASYLAAGGYRYADGGAFHGYIGLIGVTPYPMPEEDVTSGCTAFASCYGSVPNRTGQIREVFDQGGLGGKPMFQTEGSWGNGNETDPDTQVAWLARWYLLQAGLRSSLNLQMASWFAWAPPSFGWGDIATGSFQATSAGVAYGQVYSWLVGATMNQPCTGAADGTWTCSLGRANGYAAIAVWNTVGSSTFTPGAGYTQYRDLAGATTPIPAGGSVPIGAKPVLIEGTAGSCISTNVTLCVDDQPGDRRFAVQVAYQTSQGGGQSGYGHPISLASVGVTRGGAFWFFSADNPEMLVKVLDGCAANGEEWVFASAGTNVGFMATVLDTMTGHMKTYTNPDLTPAAPIADTGYEACAASSGETLDVQRARAAPALVRKGLAAVGPCVPGPATLCIDGKTAGDKRFQVEVSYQTSQGGGQSGQGQAIALAPLGITHGGAFWFFSADNPEMLVKVIDGCPINSKKWFFASAGTNVGFTLIVTDTTTGLQKSYTNADLVTAVPIQDTAALTTCP
jgi:N-acetylglucosamine-6-sulfatase